MLLKLTLCTDQEWSQAASTQLKGTTALPTKQPQGPAPTLRALYSESSSSALNEHFIPHGFYTYRSVLNRPVTTDPCSTVTPYRI